MAYVVAAYGLVAVALLGYGLGLARERSRLVRSLQGGSGAERS